jgi:hypothetical protein
MFPINSFEPERRLVVHLVVGIHVADVVVPDQVHVTKFFNSTKTEVAFQVASRACYFQIIKSDQILTILSLQFKTGIRLPLASSVKEIGAILQKLIKVWTWNKFRSKNETNEMDWCCWRCGCPRTWGLWGWARCNRRTKIVLSQELEKWEKVVLSLCLVKRKLLKEYNTN